MVIHFSPLSSFFLYQESPNYSPWAKSGPRIHFVNNENLIDEKLFYLVECNISRNNHMT